MTMQIPINPEARGRRSKNPLFACSATLIGIWVLAVLVLAPSSTARRPYGGRFFGDYVSPNGSKFVRVFVHRQGALGSDYIWVVYSTPAKEVVLWKGYIRGNVESCGGGLIGWPSEDRIRINSINKVANRPLPPRIVSVPSTSRR